MAGILTIDGAEWLLQRGLNYTSGEDQLIRLFNNDYTPVAASEIADFSECDETGYAEQNLTGTEYTITPGETTGASAEHPQVTFEFTEAANVYGYFVVNPAGTKVLWAERFASAPYEITTAGEIRVTPTVTLDQCA